MTTTRRCSLLPLFAFVGLMACSGSNSPGSTQPATGGTPPSTGGSPTGGGGTTAGPAAGTPAGGTPAGGTTTPATTSAAGGATVPVTTSTVGGTTGGNSATGGIPATGGTSRTGGTTAAGGSAGSGGTSAIGGSTPTGGAAGGRGGTTGPTGGRGGSGGSSATGGGAAGGSTGATGGSAGGAPPPATGVPAGYPAPTADNYAKCQKVAIGTNNACAGQPAGNVCIECLFGGTAYNTSETTPTAEATSAAGNYVVTVTLGGAAAGDTYVSAESSRGLLQSVTTSAGQSLTYAFAVNVRAMEGQPQHAGGPGGYPGLDLFFSGKNPQVSAIGYALGTGATKPIVVYMASDSTCCDQTGGGYGGWGQMLPEFFGPPVAIANYANSGASSNFGHWGDITSKWTAGDWVIIQFGHNDKGTADSAVQSNLEGMVSDAQAAKVNALLVSPPARATAIPIGDQSSLHAAAAKAAAAAKGVPYIDLTALSTAWYDGLGMTKTQVLTAYHAGGTDQTHTNLPGAEALAGLVAKAIKDQNIGLAPYLRQ